MIEQCPQLIAKIQARQTTPTQNLKMISVEPRPAAAINVVTRSGLTTHIQNTPNRPAEALVRKAPEKIPAFDIIREKETFMEAKKDFAGPSPPSAPAQA